MKILRFSTILAALSAMLFTLSCEQVEEPDYREQDYGYVQFKLYKEASYQPVKSSDYDLEYLSDATKVKVTLRNLSLEGSDPFSQTLVLTAGEGESSEYGLRSEKLKMMVGNYSVVTYTIYDKLDNVVSEMTPSASSSFEVVAGGLHIHDLVADVKPRGKAKFTLVKTGLPSVKSAEREEYTFDEISYITIVVKDESMIPYEFEKLPADFSVHFDESDEVEDGYQTSSIVCDSLVSLPAGKYQVTSYTTYNSSKFALETNDKVSENAFEVFDNATAEAKVPVTLYESDEYIKDYIALKEIWESLDGENWYYGGENHDKGANWNFNKDIDLWGSQPGVELHSNGRVAKLDLSDFGIRGALPAAIGQLDQIIELYLGTHNDTNLLNFDPTVEPGLNSMNRLERHSDYLKSIHPRTQMSEPVARALKERNLYIPEIALYDTMTEDEIIEKGTGIQKQSIQLMDITSGKYCNGLTSIDEAIGNLTKLERLNIANGRLSSLPKAFASMENLTDFEIYNCPDLKMTDEDIQVLASMPSLVALNISNNPHWDEAQSEKLFDALAQGESAKKIQIMYMRDCNLPNIPESICNMTSLTFLDVAYNKLTEVTCFTKDVNPVQVYFDGNQITRFKTDENGLFCGFEDIETFSAKLNLLEELPDIFSSKSIFSMESVDFSYNKISRVQKYNGVDYKGINVATLTMTNNPLKVFPVEFAQTKSQINYFNFRGCGMEEIPGEALVGENVKYITSFDLSYNHLSDLPKEFNSVNIPYLYGMDLSYNRFSSFPYEPLDSYGLTVFAIRGQRSEDGKRCLKSWPTGLYQHTGLRAFYIGSNDLRKIDDTISYLIYYLDISDNPNIEFDASDICYYYQMGAYLLIYDKTQNIKNCDIMLD